MKKLLALTLAAIMLALVACAPQSSNTPSSQPSNQPSNAPSNAPSQSAPAPSQATAPTKDTVTMAVYSDFKTFDPMNSGMTLDKVVYQNVFDTLLNLYEGEYEKTLVSDYSVSEDGLVYTFNLKAGVKFHNGETLKASDVAFSLERAKVSTSHATSTKPISKIDTPDDSTVVVTLNKPYVPFLMAVAASVPMMNEKAVSDAGENVGVTPIGTGPYKFVKFDPGQQVVLEAFEECTTNTAKIKNAVFKVIIDPSSALVATETGEIDLTYNIPPIAVTQIQSNPKLGYIGIPTLGSCYMVYNLEKAPFNDVNFRLALNYAIDPQEIIDVAVDGMAEPSNGIWDSRYAGYSPEYNPLGYNEEKAKEYLAKSGYNGEEIFFRAGYENYKKIGLVVQEQLRKIGVNMRVEQMEANAWVSDMKSGNYDISFVGMTYDLDVDYWENVFGSGAIDAYNFSRLNRPEVDKAFADGKSILDPAARAANYSVIQKVLYEEAVVVPVYFKTSPCAYNADLKINRVYPLGFAKVCDLEWTK